MNESENPRSGTAVCSSTFPAQGRDRRRKDADPFEVYALAGAAFGDTEDQKIESLARQAMPQKAEEITRLFREGKPDIALLDGLEKHRGGRSSKRFSAPNPEAEIIASALCDTAKAEAVDDKPGCVEELLRLCESAVGLQAGVRVPEMEDAPAEGSE
jgi:hypothetical protein